MSLLLHEKLEIAYQLRVGF